MAGHLTAISLVILAVKSSVILSTAILAPKKEQSIESIVEKERLLEKARLGDEKAFNRLWEQYEESTLYMAQDMLGSRDDAEDVLQDARIRLQAKIQTYEKIAFGALMRRFVWNRAIDILRKRKETTSIPENYPSTESSPYDSVTALNDNLDEFLNGLTNTEKQIIKLRIQQDLEFEQIAHIIKKSVSGSRQLYHRVIQKLRKSQGIAKAVQPQKNPHNKNKAQNQETENV